MRIKANAFSKARNQSLKSHPKTQYSQKTLEKEKKKKGSSSLLWALEEPGPEGPF